MVFHNFGLLWIVDNNKHLKFDMEVQVHQCMYKDPWYNTTMAIALEIFTKQDARTSMNWCVLPVCTIKSMYQFLMIQVVAVSDQWQLRHLKEHLSHLVIFSTLLIIGFNDLNAIMITELWYIKIYDRVIQNNPYITSSKKLMIIKKNIRQISRQQVGNRIYKRLIPS